MKKFSINGGGAHAHIGNDGVSVTLFGQAEGTTRTKAYKIAERLENLAEYIRLNAGKIGAKKA